MFASMTRDGGTATLSRAPGMEVSIRSTIIALMSEVAKQQKKRLGSLSDGLPLLESGLDSLCIAILVAALDDRLHLDPFAIESSPLPSTLGEFISLYEHAAA